MPDSTGVTDSSWIAFCDFDHPHWVGPDEAEFDGAQNDAIEHDNAVHGGDRVANVIERSNATKQKLQEISFSGLACAGNACKDAVVTFDNQTKSYRVHNKGKRHITVSFYNGVITNNVPLNPGETKETFIKNSYIAPYRANYS